MQNISVIKRKPILPFQLRRELVEFWPLDEASGTRRGAVNGLDLTDNNTVTGNPGACDSLASQFTVANSEYLSRASEAALQVGDIDFTFAAWVYLTDHGTRRTIISKWNSAAGDIREYWLGFRLDSATNVFGFYVSNNGTFGASTLVSASTFGVPATNTWNLVIAWYDHDAGTINVSVNNGSVNSATHSGAFAGTSNFRIGEREGGNDYWNGRIQRVGFWKRLLTSEARTYLYNNGCGRDWPFYSN